MNYDNKKMIAYGSIIVAVLIALIVFLFLKYPAIPILRMAEGMNLPLFSGRYP